MSELLFKPEMWLVPLEPLQPKSKIYRNDDLSHGIVKYLRHNKTLYILSWHWCLNMIINNLILYLVHRWIW